MTPEERAAKLWADGAEQSYEECVASMAAAIREAVAEEREACAAVADASAGEAAQRGILIGNRPMDNREIAHRTLGELVSANIAKAIRARTTPAPEAPAPSP